MLAAIRSHRRSGRLNRLAFMPIAHQPSDPGSPLKGPATSGVTQPP